MPNASIEKQKDDIQKKKKKLLLKEKLIKEQEKQAQSKRLAEIGKLARKAEIDQMDEESLLGAFLDIAERNNEKKNIENWKQKAKAFLDNIQDNSQEALIISFVANPSLEVRSLLRKLNFKWNNFRKEFYGYGDRKSLESALSGYDFRIEVAE